MKILQSRELLPAIFSCPEPTAKTSLHYLENTFNHVFLRKQTYPPTTSFLISLSLLYRFRFVLLYTHK
jgi:hypothetical protein